MIKVFLTIVFLLISVINTAPHAFACLSIPDRGISISDLPTSSESHNSSSIQLSAISVVPNYKCEGGGIKLHLITENPRVPFDGFLIVKLVDSDAPGYITDRFQNASKIVHNTAHFGYLPEFSARSNTIDIKFQVKYIDRTGSGSQWSETYGLLFTGEDESYIKRYFKPELDSDLQAEIVKTANSIVTLLLETDRENYDGLNKTSQWKALSYQRSNLENTLREQVQTYTQAEISNVDALTSYRAYGNFTDQSQKYFLALLRTRDLSEYKRNLVNALERIRTEQPTCSRITYVPDPRFSNKHSYSCQ